MTSPSPAVQEIYVPPEGKPEVYLVDIDGTVAIMNGRGPFDWDRVGEDLPNTFVVNMVRRAANRDGSNIIFFSGRMDVCRLRTTMWLSANVIPSWRELYMRAEGDYRPDDVVKCEMFDRFIRNHFDVQAVFDDRAKVVKMWRLLGLGVFDVAGGTY